MDKGVRATDVLPYLPKGFIILFSHHGTAKKFVRRGPQRFYQIKVGKNVYLMHTKPCNTFGLGNFINAAIRVKGDIGKAYRKLLHRRSCQQMHVHNCEMIVNYVKNSNLACPIYYKVVEEVPAFHELSSSIIQN